jgi:Cu-Zn family superoxide dismutase
LGAESALLDEDGSSLMLHADPDDYQTDPAGHAGGRIACGVIAP